VIVELPYGRTPYVLDLGEREVEVVRAIELPPPRPVEALVDDALAAPIGGPALHVAAGARVTVIVSDATRVEPRAAFLAALRRRLAGCRWTIAIATGTHGRCGVDALDLPAHVVRDAQVVEHDGVRDLVELGTTTRGTPMRVHRCVVDADLVIATGCIRPHYFAGFGAGAKAIFPGLGCATAIRINHRLKTAPEARAGVVVGNPCRDDVEEAVAMVPTPMFLLNGVCGPSGAVHAAVVGHVVDAFRAGCELARPWFAARARPAPLVIASDHLPITATLYQAAKIAAAAAPLVAPGGTLVVAAECADGIGPIDVVNEAIFRIGVLPRLPRDARLLLVSELAPERVRETLLEHVSDARDITAQTPGRIIVVPRASSLLLEALS
jgi:nickel-dependent lactate racemase